MLNGYYCGHFGEDMNALEIAAGIRWHYENGYNLLSDSTALPDEPAEPEEAVELTLTIGLDQAKAIAQEVVKTVRPAIDYAVKKRMSLRAGLFRQLESSQNSRPSR